MMKYALGILAVGLMIWALIEQTNAQPNIWVQISAVIVFFYVMMRLMDKTPGKFDKEQEDTEYSEKNQTDKEDRQDV